MPLKKPSPAAGRKAVGRRASREDAATGIEDVERRLEEFQARTINLDRMRGLEKVGILKKLQSWSPVALASERAPLLDGFDRITPPVIAALSDAARIHEALSIRERCVGSWDRGAQYLYRCLLRALGLWEYEQEMMELAKPKRGRKRERKLEQRIRYLRSRGWTFSRIQSLFRDEGRSMSREAIEAFTKARRRTPKY